MLFLLGLAFCAAALAAPRVAVTLKPLEHLTAALTAGILEPALLLEGGQDPHRLTLRPSQRRMLDNVDLVIWLGPAMELPLADLMPQLEAEVLTVTGLPGLRLIHDAQGLDPHLWLDTGNALHIAEAVADRLIALDPANRGAYERNLERFGGQLREVERSIREELSPREIQAWAVDHHAFRYFEAQFGMPEAIMLKGSDNTEPGLRTALAFKAAMQEEGLDCVLTETGVNPQRLRALLDMPALEVVAVDHLGSALTVTADSFSELLLSVAKTIEDCARGAHD